ncbi:ATPase [Amycolatopsis sp. NBRC 101858]|uniref:sensor histidine kinase n=1 Tax=Amycolatopsis sp. NBRC 101858 TaxID=3032200 RepID=UPI0024A0A734|nr:sensor histidine kinase [Amycolatopsis sp. NBRC 101858]GLY42890.1 ATPase [Amycolatopsis sp. NBRC 101858]
MPTSRQQYWDIAVGILLAAGVAASTVLSRNAGIDPGALRPGQGEELAWSLAIGLPLCLRRRFPLTVLTACVAALIGLQLRFLGDSTVSSICLFLAFYTVGAWSRHRRRATVVRIGIIVTMSGYLGYAVSSSTWPVLNGLASGPPAGPLPALTASALSTIGTNILFLSGAWIFGNAAWAQARQHSELAERNRELQDEREENARNAVIMERFRIARELHDVVAHHVSIMGVQAAAARMTGPRDPAVEQMLASIESAGRDAIDEMHRLLGVLRGGGQSEDATPAAGVEQLMTLTGQPRGTLQVTYTVSGKPRELPQSLSISLYRIAQEALTNTARHANASKVDVSLSYRNKAVELTIVDDGPLAKARAVNFPSRARPSGSGKNRGGLGHTGMRERVALHDGTLQLGPDADGYAVRARFPLS